MNGIPKKIIAVLGSGNSGKTATLRRFLERRGIHHLKSGDITIAISVCVQGEKVLVGIATGGDTEQIIRKNLDYLESINCEIIVCASKSEGRTIDLIRSRALNQRNTLCEIRKTKAVAKQDRAASEVGICEEIEEKIFD